MHYTDYKRGTTKLGRITMSIDYKDIVETEYGSLVGKVVMQVRPLVADEIEGMGWDVGHHGSVPMAIFFDDMSYIIPSCDPEGNAAGHLFYEL